MLTYRQWQLAEMAEVDERMKEFKRTQMQSLAQMREMGVKKFEYSAAADAYTCGRCERLDGKKKSVQNCTEYDIPPFADCDSPRGCRTIIVAAGFGAEDF